MNQQGKTFSALAVRRPVLIIVMNLLIVIAGGAAVFGIDVRELPNVDRPTVTVRATYDGASPETIDAEVTRVIEGAIARVNGVREIRSSSEENNCRVRIEFQPGVNLTDAANDIREAINRNRRQLPDDVEEVFVVKADDDADPIIQLSAVSNSLSKDELAQKIEKDILPAFLSIQGVAEVRLSGNQKRELRVLLKPEQMSKLKVNVSLVEDVLRNARLDIPAGSYKSGDQELLVRANASMSTPQQIRQLILRENVYLEDVAVVFFAPEEAESYARLNGSIVIGLDVVRQAGANTINISKDVDKQVEQINRRNRDLEIIKTSDDAVFIEGAIQEVLISLLFSVSIVILVIVLFIGSIRATLVPAVAIPISLVGTFSAIWLMGLSINLLTLLALVLATGLIVDDAIVVLENIQRHQKNGVKNMAAAVIGSQQVFFAVIATTVTLVSVFLPITFLPSEAGKLFREFGLVLSVSVIISSVVALTLCPMMASRLSILETEKTWFPMTKSFLNFCGQMFGRFYNFSLKICIQFPLICLLSILVLCCGSWPIFQSLKQELVPDEDRGSVRIMLTGPDGASLPYSDRQAEKLETIMYPYYKQGIITNIYTTVGQYDKNRSSIVATLKNWEDRDINQIELTKKIQERLEEIPGAQARVRGGNSLGVRGGGGGLELALLGNNYTEISAAADALVRAVERLPSVTDARAEFDTSQPELSFEIDRRKTNDLGVDITDIARTLRAMVDGYEVARLNINDEEVPIILGSIDGTADDPEDLLNVFMVNNQQNLIPLLSFVNIKESGIAAELDRHKQRRAIAVDIGLKPDAVLSDVVREVEKIGDEVLPSGVNILLLGDAADLGETSHELSLTFGLAILIVFLVLAAQFESIGSAFIVIFTVPFGLAAAIYALHFTGQSINLYSQIGLVMLVGLMTKNSILFVEFMDQLREEGAEVKDAILRGAEIRLRPVMMTVLSTVVGSLPLVLSSGPGSEARSAIGWVIFGGLGLATFLTLYLTPIGYALIAPFVKPRSHAQKILETQLQEVEKVASQGIGPNLEQNTMRENKIVSSWRSIKKITTAQDRKYIYFLGMLSFFVSIIESVGISLVVPFIALVQKPDVIFTNRFLSRFVEMFSLDSKQIIVYLGIVLIVFYIGRALFNTAYYFLLHKFSFAQKHQLTVGLFCQYLRMPYKDFLERNSSSLMKNIDIEAGYATQLILHFLYLFSELLTILLLYGILVYVNWKITIFLTIALVLQILLLEKCISPLAKKMGEQRTTTNKVFWRVMKDSFANFKMLKILSRQEKTIQQIENASKKLSHANAIGNSIGIIPRNFLETTGIVVVITIMICSVYFYGNATSIITTISIFFLALYRILPALNRVLTSYNQILFMYPSLEIIAQEFTNKYDNLPYNPIAFESEIELRNIDFCYTNDKPILQDVSLKIPKNSKVAFIGESGSGKTTLIDLIIALYTPNAGQMFVDGQELTSKFYLNWRQKIGYIPQDIYLFDGTLAQNISLCLHSDEEKIIQVLHQTNLLDFFASREGLQTHVGDGGLKLSGGQKQRVGIARALYNDPEILVLDEATSALDEATEKKIIDEIYAISENKTIFIVTHRLSTIQNCELIYEVKNRNIRKFAL